MDVRELFERLSFGELSALSIGSEGAGTIPAEKQSRVLSCANTVLTDLHSRFYHKQGLVTVQLDASITKYQLKAVNAQTNVTVGNTAPRYIKDTASEPFTGNLIRIVSASLVPLTEAQLQTLGLTETEMSWKIVSHDTLRVTNPLTGAMLLVEYQENHPKLSLSPVVLTQEISLSPVLEEALVVKIAAMIYAGMDGEAQLIKARELKVRYEEICQMTKAETLIHEANPVDHDHLLKGGFI